MIFKFKSRKQIKTVLLFEAILLPSCVVLLFLLGKVWAPAGWNRFDYQILDFFYKYAVQHGYGPPRSDRIVYMTITDDSYKYFGKNSLDRAALARVNEALAEFGAAAVAYDIIFARPSTSEVDQRFLASLQQLGVVYLPIGLDLRASGMQSFEWGEGRAYERLRTQLRQLRARGVARPLSAAQALMQLDDFALAAFNTGHIFAASDSDGVYRHLPLLFQIDMSYLPALTLSMFLDAVKVPFEALTVEWGRTITIPAIPGSTLTRDVVVPIDEHGRAFVPYPQMWDRDFERMSVDGLLQYIEDVDLRGNLQEFFENKFVFIGDVSTGISDLGQTPLERHVPLIAMHTAFMNALLSNSFYRQWSFRETVGLIGAIGLLIGAAALLQASAILYVTGGLILLGLMALTWVQCVHFALLPIATVSGGFLYIFFGLVMGLEVAIARDQAFIRDAFAKYVSEKVVNELVLHPELLHLGGEERVLSVLFTDIADFTTISEHLSPQELVYLLNEYLTAMTTIVLEEGGIIDKYVGDSIMAEFGAPLPIPQNADLAVRTALRMQGRLQELRPKWVKEGLPEVHCRVGINTGPMIVGNIGSDQVFNYTVIGDAVNLASRLEGANKHYKTMVMISEFTHNALTPNVFRTRLLDVVRVKGKSQAVKVYEVYGEVSDPIPPKDLLYYQTYTAAFEAYLGCRFDVAHAQFSSALTLRPNDTAALEMLARIDDLDPEALPDDWDGALTLETK